MSKNIVVLISGRGSNFKAVYERSVQENWPEKYGVRISGVISNRPEAGGLTFAKENSIPFQVESFLGRTGTDADKMHQSADGVVTALLSLPLRYMHSPSEVCHIQDIEHAIKLLGTFLCTINEDTNLDPFA